MQYSEAVETTTDAADVRSAEERTRDELPELLRGDNWSDLRVLRNTVSNAGG